eukprot:g8201.t1
MDNERLTTPRAPRRRARASLSMATPPNLTTLGRTTPFSTVGNSRGLKGLGIRKGRRGRASLSMATSPLVVPGAVAFGGAGDAGEQQDAGKDESPWVGGRAESPSTAVPSPLPSTRGEMAHFRRAEQLWREASKAREGSRRRTMGAAPTLEQRMAWRREQEEEEAAAAAAGKRGGMSRPELGEQRKVEGRVPGTPPPRPPASQRNGQDGGSKQPADGAGVAAGGAKGGNGSNSGVGGGIGVPPPLPPGTQRACGGGGGVLQEGGVQGEKRGGAEDSLDRATVRAKVLAIYQEHNKEKLHSIDDVLDKYAGRWGVMLQRLEEKYISASGLPPASGSGPTCFMDIEVGGEAIGRLVFRLFADKTPKTAENFRALCTGEKGRGLRYEGSAFHRIIPGFVVQGGDFTTGDGRGGKSIYGDKFEDEPFMRHHKLGLLSMANKGANTNNSQFFITLKAVAHLDGKHVVFGELQSGIKVLDRMKSVTLLEPKKDGKPVPEQRVVIARCGQLNEDGTEAPRAAAALTPATPLSAAVFAPPSPSTPFTSTALPGQPSNLGGPTATSGSIIGAGAASPPPPGVSSPPFGWGQSGSGGAFASKGFGASGGGGDGGNGRGGGGFGAGLGGSVEGLFGSAPKAPAAVPTLFGKPIAAADSPPTPAENGGGGGGGGGRSTTSGGLFGAVATAAAVPAPARLPGTPSVVSVASSFGSLAAAVAAGPPGNSGAATGAPFLAKSATSPARAASSPPKSATSPVAGVGGGAGGSKGGFSTPTPHSRYFATPPSDLAAITVRGAALTPASAGRRSSGPRPPGGAAGAAFDRLDNAGTGWVGQEEFEALIVSAGLPVEAEKHRRALLELCSPRLPRDRFLEWYAAARKEQRESIGGGSTGSSGTAPARAAAAAKGAITDAREEEHSVEGEEGYEASERSGDESDSGDEEERREERAKAEKAFDEVDSDGSGRIGESQFEALMEAVGTTYSVEDHRPKLLSICREGKLAREAFLSWYDEWLFGGDDSSDDEEKEGQVVGGEKAAGQHTDGFAALVKSQQAGGWKCGACLVSNPGSSLKCLSCETAKPGEEGKAGSGSGGGVLGGSSGRSTGGFMFGAPAATATAGPPLATSSAFSTNASGGFTFGAAPAAPTTTTAATPTPAAGPSVPRAGTNASGGFTFGAPVAASSPAAPTTEQPTAAAAVSDDEATAASAAGDDRSSDDDSGDEGERREERAKAEKAFDEVDSDGSGRVGESQFEALMEAVGTTYSVEDHRPKLLSICREGKLAREAFLSWYDEWLFGGDDSSDDEEEEGQVSSGESAAGQRTDGFAALVKSQQAGGWKCGACLVSNPGSSLKCLSCETAKPGEEGKAGSGSGGGVLGGSSGRSTGGFMFGAPAATATAGPPLATSSAFSTNASGGFTFGAALSAPTTTTAATPTPAAGPSVPRAGTNASGGFTFGAPVAASSPAAPTTEQPTAAAAVSDDEATAASAAGDDRSSDDDSGDEGERREERAKAEKAFDEVDSDGSGRVGESQFEALMEAVGTTYSVEDHRPKLLSICREGKLAREAFLSWYDEWLFGGDDSSDDEEEEGQVSSGESAAGQRTDGFAALVKSQQAGGWKCGACLVSNPASSLKCLSCETAKPGEEGNTAAAAVGSGLGGGIFGGVSGGSTGGFTFGAPAVATVPTAAIPSNVPTNAAGGFTFGAAPAAATTPTSAPAVAPGGLRFGPPAAAAPAAAAASTPAAPAAAPPDSGSSASATKTAGVFPFGTVPAVAAGTALPHTPVNSAESAKGFAFGVVVSSSGSEGSARSGASSPVAGLPSFLDSTQSGDGQEGGYETLETRPAKATGGDGDGTGQKVGVGESPFTFVVGATGGDGVAAGGGGARFGSLKSPPGVVAATGGRGGGGDVFGAGSSTETGGATSPKAL